MSKNSTGTANGWRWGRQPSVSGNMARVTYSAGKLDGWDGSSNSHGAGLKIDVSHTHTYGTDDDIETRPTNYTIRIWKRIA